LGVELLLVGMTGSDLVLEVVNLAGKGVVLVLEYVGRLSMVAY
jgi:hypothetical protein